MSSAESQPKPDHKMQLSHAADVVQPADSESKEGPNTRAASQAESLLAAEKRTLQMIASRESIKDVLNDLCCSIDVQASPVISTVLLMDDLFSLSFLEVPSSRFRQNVFEPVSRNYINL